MLLVLDSLLVSVFGQLNEKLTVANTFLDNMNIINKKRYQYFNDFLF